MDNNPNTHKLEVISYNCKHFVNRGAKFDFIDSLKNECDFIFLQEHWLYKSEFDKLDSIGPGYDKVATSAMDETIERTGRPFGGCAILWNPAINGSFTKLVIDNNRLCGVLCVFNNVSVLFLNVYMPCDRYVEDAEYIDVMNLIKQS